jgi:hypothetical protein
MVSGSILTTDSLTPTNLGQSDERASRPHDLTVSLRDRLDDLFHVRNRPIRDQDFSSESFRELKSIAESYC